MPLLATREQRTKEQNKEINCTCPVMRGGTRKRTKLLCDLFWLMVIDGN